MKFRTDIYGSKRMKSTDFGDVWLFFTNTTICSQFGFDHDQLLQNSASSAGLYVQGYSQMLSQQHAKLWQC